MTDEPKTFGTLANEAPITRDDFERAVRNLHLSDIDAHALLLHLAAQVVALTEELQRRFDAPTPEAVAEPLQAGIQRPLPQILQRIQSADSRSRGRVWMDTSLDDKYDVESSSPPCEELIPLWRALLPDGVPALDGGSR